LARRAVESLGDSIVPPIAAAILRAWMKAERGDVFTPDGRPFLATER